MECSSNFPINVKLSNQKGNCKIKCDLQCDYYNSKCIATNKKNYISLSYDENKIPPILFNNVSFYVKEVRIYSPSLHKYENVTADGEIVIIHKGFEKNLAICIPIRKEDTDKGLLNEIVSQCGSVIINENETSNLKLSDYNLSHFVPLNRPIMHYLSRVPFDCGVLYDTIVFGNRQDYIPIGNIHLEILNKLISSQKIYKVNENTLYFVNESGAKKKVGNKYSVCYYEKDLPANILSEYEKYKKEQPVEGFMNMNNILIDDNSIHMGYLLLIILASYGIFLYITEVMKLKNK